VIDRFFWSEDYFLARGMNNGESERTGVYIQKLGRSDAGKRSA
jgi:hypothetical protein